MNRKNKHLSFSEKGCNSYDYSAKLIEKYNCEVLILYQETNPVRAIVDYCKYTECNESYHVKHVKSPNLYGVHYVVKCTDIYYDDGQVRQKLKEGYLYFFPANIDFSLSYQDDCKDNYYHIYWLGFVSRPGLCDCIIEYNVNTMPKLRAMIPLFSALTDENYFTDPSIMSYVVNQFVSTLLLLLNQEIPFTSIEKTQLETVIFYIHENINGDLSSHKLAEIAMLNRSSFYDLFHKQMKLTPHQYITEIKMLKAKDQLMSNVKVTEISKALGYSDEKTFSRAFYNHTGCSPTAYKKKKKCQEL